MATPQTGARGRVLARRRFSSLMTLCALAASLAGCSSESRHRLLVFLFEEVPPAVGDTGSAPVIRSPRHPPPHTATPTPAPVAQADASDNDRALIGTWDDAVRRLPKNAVGSPDWVAALDQKIIAPRPGIAPDAVEPDALTLDVELASRSDPAFNVIFSHQKHGAWLACANCHPTPFAMRAGATPMSAQETHAGGYCAVCHGTVAFDMVTGCPLCHLRRLPKDRSGGVDWDHAVAQHLIAPRPGRSGTSEDRPILDLDVNMKSAMQPAFNSVFSHKTHTTWLACTNCHPQLFPMEAPVADAPAADLHSRRYCGACHGSVAFGLTDTCTRCHPAFQKAKQHQPVLDLDVEIVSKSSPPAKTIFSHKLHTWLECSICHAGEIESAAAVTKMTTAEIQHGKYCAVCHGKVAVDLMTRCQPCHAGDAQ